MFLWLSHESYRLKQDVQRTTTSLSPKISERIAHSLANRLETVRVSHWPIAWLIYLPCTMTQCQSHCASNIIQFTSLSFQVSQLSHSWVTAISIFLPWKSKIKVMGEVKVWSHNVSLTFYRLTSLSFHVNQPSHSWNTAVSKFDLEYPRSRSWVRWTLKVTKWVKHPIDSHAFRSMSIGPSIPDIQHFQNLTLKIQGQGQITMMLHSYRSRNSIEPQMV